MLKYVLLITTAARFFVGMAHMFDGRDDDCGSRGGPPELAPWPQSPGDLRPEVLTLDCVLDGRRTSGDARELAVFPGDK